VQLDPRNYDALYNVGNALARDGALDAARPYLEQFLRTAPPAFYERTCARLRASCGARVSRRDTRARNEDPMLICVFVLSWL